MKNRTVAAMAVVASLVLSCPSVDAQITSGTIFGTGLGSVPGGRDSNWTIVAVPNGFTPPAGQTTPYGGYVPTSTVSAFTGGGSPQAGLVYLGGTNYWIAPQATTSSLVGGLYNWVAQQQFTVPQAGFYRFDFPGAGDNELEFYIDGFLNRTDPKRPTITGGQQIGGRAGTFTSMTTFTGGAQLAAGTHTASMVLWDYGGETGALIGSSTFAPAVAYWAPGSGAGGNGTWTNSNAYWTTDAAGLTTKQPWTSGVGVAYFGGTAGTVSVGANVNVNQIYFTTGGYLVQGSGGDIVYGNGGTITAQSGTATITATQSAESGLKIAAGSGTVVLTGVTNLGWQRSLLVDGGKLVMNGTVNSPIGNGFVYLSGGSLSGTGTINNGFGGSGLVNPGPSGTASGILTATQLSPADGVDFAFTFSGTAPNYASAGNSVNDVVRLTGGTPFSSGMTTANIVSIFFNDITATTLEELQSLTGDKWTGGFFTNESAAFSSSVVNSGFHYYVYGDGNGTRSFNGTNYYSLRDIDPGWTLNFGVSTEATVANFAGGADAGRVMSFTLIVPEPHSVALLAVAGVVCGGWAVHRRRRRA